MVYRDNLQLASAIKEAVQDGSLDHLVEQAYMVDPEIKPDFYSNYEAGDDDELNAIRKELSVIKSLLSDDANLEIKNQERSRDYCEPVAGSPRDIAEFDDLKEWVRLFDAVGVTK